MTSLSNSRVRLPMSPVSFNVQVEWHSPDQVHAAALVRDGQPWLLGGALVGMGSTPGKAVDELAGAARHLVIHGRNYLTTEPLSLADREWLFALLAAAGLERDDEMHAAIRVAREEAPGLAAEVEKLAVAGVTLEVVRDTLRAAGYSEAAGHDGGTLVTAAGWRGYENDGTVRLSYWAADDDWDGANLATPAPAAIEAGMHARYKAALEAAGFMVAASPGSIVVTVAPVRQQQETRDTAPGDLAGWTGEHPQLVEDATRFALGRKTVWATLVQRHVRVGYAQAGILLDVLEQRGVVGPAGSDGKRDVLGPPTDGVP